MDAHRPEDAKLKDWPPHCVEGTRGALKLPETLLARRFTLAPEASKPPPLRPGIQMILQKRHMDPFAHPCARELVEKSGVDRWIVMGVMTDYGVRLAALGLLKLGRKVTVATDAVQGWSQETTRQAVIEMQAAGADFRTTGAILRQLSPPRRKARKKKEKR